MSTSAQLEAWLNGTPTGGPNSDGRYPLIYADGQTYLVYCPAAQALNPALTEQPIEVFANTATAAANTATAEAAEATTASLAAQTSAANALSSQNAAASSATAAGTSATNAANSATAAGNSATAASDSAGTATTANTNAGLARDKAQKWADENVDTTVEPGKYSARHWAQKAADSVAGGHTHTIANVTGLQTELDAKLARNGGNPVATSFTAGGMTLFGINSGAGTNLSLLDFAANRWLAFDIAGDFYRFNGTRTVFDARIGVSGDGNPGLATAAVTVAGAFGGGYRMIDGTVHTGMWTQNDGTMRFGIGTSAGLTQRLSLTGTGMTLNGVARADAYVAEQGAPATQQILGTWKYATGPDRVYHVLEGTGAYSLYMLNASGVAVGDYQKFEIALDAKRVAFNSDGISTLGNLRGRDIRASRGDGTGVIYLNAAESRYVYFDGVNYAMPGAQLFVNGSQVWHGGNLNPANAANLTTGTLSSSVMPAGLGYNATQHNNWNDASSNGLWVAAGALNSPPGGGWYIGRVTVHNSDWITQEVYDFTNNPGTNVYRRQKSSGVWGAWTRNQYICGVLFEENSGVYIGGTTRLNGANDAQLAANAASWVRIPRHFVQATDPGAAAADGDLWSW